MTWLGLFATSCLAGNCWRDTACSDFRPAFVGDWEKNSYSPATRTVQPASVLDLSHNVLGQYPSGIPALSKKGSGVIFDFGKEVGGIVTVTYTSTGSGTLGLAFTEARTFTSTNSDESNGGSGPDGALLVPVSTTTTGTYTMPLKSLRGGFRYMTAFSNADGPTINIKSVSLELSFNPKWPDLRAYGGYFNSNDQLLNRIWYACAYTIQVTSVATDSGRVYPLSSGWENDAPLGKQGDTILVDGAKRDRSSWSGDYLVAVPATLISTGDLDSAKWAIQAQYDYQVRRSYSTLNLLLLINAQDTNTGELPFAGPPLIFYGSDTYHIISLIVTYDYVLYSNDMAFLNTNWAAIVKALNFITAKIDSTGLLYVTGTNNWGRAAPSSGHATDANALLYRALNVAATMAGWVNQDGSKYTALANKLKTALNSKNFNTGSG